jgi:hypothetical protein
MPNEKHVRSCEETVGKIDHVLLKLSLKENF